MAAHDNSYWHRALERRTTLFAVLATVAVAIGGAVEIVPMYFVEAAAPEGDVEPYSPLELAGRDIYIREGCYNCHSQMIRPTYAETLRYGEWTRSYELMWDRPFQLGSRRIGPDLAREGGIRSDAWHYDHFRDPRSLQVGSIMPSYEWLLSWKIDPADVQASVEAMKTLGVPYEATDLASVEAALQAQGNQIVANLAENGVEAEWDDEVIALIAYMQHLGTTLQLPAGDVDTDTASN